MSAINIVNPTNVVRSTHSNLYRYTATTSRLFPSFKLVTIGSRAFSVAAAYVWNALPGGVVSASFIDSFCYSYHSAVSTLVDLV